MPLISTPPSLGTLARSGLAPISINGIGDSITAQPSYQPSSNAPNFAPIWSPSTAYTVGQVVANVGYAFHCVTAGTTASSGSGPAPSTSSITDGTIIWSFLSAFTNKDSMLGWAEVFSQGALVFDQTQGYGGLLYSLRKILVISGGSNYTSPTVILNQGAAATAIVAGGVITGVTITNPGWGQTGFTVSVSDPTGSGAVLSAVQDGSGTFGVFGCQTTDMVARLPDCLASNIQIFTVLGGTNDIMSNATYATITGNLRTIYETLMAAGRKVIALPIFPRYLFTSVNSALMQRVNRWIRAYCRGTTWANPLGYTQIVLADCGRYLVDGTVLAEAWPVGGSGGTGASVTYDGTHPNTRGRMYVGNAIWQASQKFLGPIQLSPGRAYSALDGYDANYNPGGNYLEALPWTASASGITVGLLRNNASNVYRCSAITTGTTGTTGPSGTSSSITDAGVTWAYVRPAGMSVFGSGTTGTQTAAAGITYSGSLASGFTLLRGSGSAAGTVTCAIESPWSDGTIGARQSLAFSLGGGAANENWNLRTIYAAYGNSGILASDLGSTPFYAEAEVELSGLSNMCSLNLQIFDGSTGFYAYAGATTIGVGYHMAGASGDLMALPNNGKLRLVTTPMVFPVNIVNASLVLNFGFDASGAAGSAAATVKLNYIGLFRSGAA